jgi:hypothetical protein
MRAFSVVSLTIVAIVAPASSRAAVAADDPFADEVVDFDAGVGGVEGYDNPLTVLGMPERFTGEGVFPSVVSPFSPPYGLDEIVSIGTGGWVIVRFDEPVVDHPGNPFGIDLLIFSNTGFIDSSWPNGVVGGVFSADGGVVEVSADGEHWEAVNGVAADGLFPTLGYLDSGPYDNEPGMIESDFTQPVDPVITIDDLLGLSHSEVVNLYAGSGGGAGIDLAGTGLKAISFVRIANPGDLSVEIDAFADVAATRHLATLESFTIARGSPISGELDDLTASDDESVHLRSGFGATFIDLHSSDVVVHANTDITSPASLSLTVESRIGHPTGQMVIRLRRWSTAEFATVGSFTAGEAEVVRAVAGIDAAPFVNAAGDIDVSILHRVFVPMFAFRFDAWIDHVVIEVE